jgi:hypothetical protein
MINASGPYLVSALSVNYELDKNMTYSNDVISYEVISSEVIAMSASLLVSFITPLCIISFRFLMRVKN